MCDFQKVPQIVIVRERLKVKRKVSNENANKNITNKAILKSEKVTLRQSYQRTIS